MAKIALFIKNSKEICSKFQEKKMHLKISDSKCNLRSRYRHVIYDHETQFRKKCSDPISPTKHILIHIAHGASSVYLCCNVNKSTLASTTFLMLSKLLSNVWSFRMYIEHFVLHLLINWLDNNIVYLCLTLKNLIVIASSLPHSHALY